MAPRYPLTPTFDTGHLKVSDIHDIYYEQAGKQDGVPILFLHGTPFCLKLAGSDSTVQPLAYH